MRTSRAGICPDTAGFTLLELTIVVLLVSLFTLLAVPLFSGPADGALASSARRISGTVKQLYNEAVLTGREHRLVFYLERGTYAARFRDASGELKPLPGLAEEIRLRDGVSFADVTVAGIGQSSQGEIVTVISPAGWLPETVIHLSGGDARRLTLRVLSFTGTTEVYEGYREF